MPSHGTPAAPAQSQSEHPQAKSCQKQSFGFLNRLSRFKRLRMSRPANLEKPASIAGPSQSKKHRNGVMAVRSTRLICWLFILGSLSFAFPSCFGFPVLAEALHRSLTSHLYSELRQLHPFYKPDIHVLPLVVTEWRQESTIKQAPFPVESANQGPRSPQQRTDSTAAPMPSGQSSTSENKLLLSSCCWSYPLLPAGICHFLHLAV